MTQPFASSIDGLAQVIADKWYAALGAAGLITGMWVMILGTPHDDLLIACIAAAMVGIGFGEAETRTFRQRIHRLGLIEVPERQFTHAGAVLYLVGVSSVILAAARGLQLYLGAS